jgi:hypothetical protein
VSTNKVLHEVLKLKTLNKQTNKILYEIFLVQQMHYLLKHKIPQFVFKCLNVHFSAPTCFGPLGPSSGSIHQNLAKVTKITVF